MKNQVELRPRTLIAIALNALALGALAGLLIFADARQRLFDPSTPSRDVGTALIGGPFKLISHTGNLVSDTSFRGRAMIVTFGFTNEPDLTPATLQVLSGALDRLGPKVDRVAAIFITLDPERDTPANLSKYLEKFDSRLIGLTGTAREIAAVAKAYRVPVELVVDPATPSQTTIAYEPLIYLMNRQGEYVTHLSQGLTVEEVMQALRQQL